MTCKFWKPSQQWMRRRLETKHPLSDLNRIENDCMNETVVDVRRKDICNVDVSKLFGMFVPEQYPKYAARCPMEAVCGLYEETK